MELEEIANTLSYQSQLMRPNREKHNATQGINGKQKLCASRDSKWDEKKIEQKQKALTCRKGDGRNDPFR